MSMFLRILSLELLSFLSPQSSLGGFTHSYLQLHLFKNEFQVSNLNKDSSPNSCICLTIYRPGSFGCPWNILLHMSTYELTISATLYSPPTHRWQLLFFFKVYFVREWHNLPTSELSKTDLSTSYHLCLPFILLCKYINISLESTDCTVLSMTPLNAIIISFKYISANYCIVILYYRPWSSIHLPHYRHGNIPKDQIWLWSLKAYHKVPTVVRIEP